MTVKYTYHGQVTKIDEALGLVIGYAIVCNEGGTPYFDLQDEHIPEDAMLKASLDFMQNSRLAGEMHAEDAAGQTIDAGQIVFAFPMTTDIAKSLGVTVERTGLLIGMKPDAAMLSKFVSGDLAGFSIGGGYIPDQIQEVAGA